MKRLFYHAPYEYSEDTINNIHQGVLGAIVGDIVGSRHEFKRNKERDFELFTDRCDFTDDSVMTIAVAKTLMHYKQIKDIEEFKMRLIYVLHEVGVRYPDCGYGGRFLGTSCHSFFGSHNMMSSVAVAHAEEFNLVSALYAFCQSTAARNLDIVGVRANHKKTILLHFHTSFSKNCKL